MPYPYDAAPVVSVELIDVIYVQVDRGSTEADKRIVNQYWGMDGGIIAEFDEHNHPEEPDNATV